mgnify:CR=1 FL=1
MRQHIAGVDEAGRGPLAGPVVVAAVVLDPQRPIAGLADSKKLSAARRDALALEIKTHARFAVVEVDAATIDRMNILAATLHGMRLAVEALDPLPSEAWIDGNRLPQNMPCASTAFVKGDALHACISAASILAKTHRDALMRRYAEQFPGYGFADHMGYPTSEHLAALKKLGPSAIHRLSFRPVRELVDGDLWLA